MNSILIIDDQFAKVEALIGFLEKKGYRVLYAASGKEGLAVIHRERPSFTICDLEMPSMGGYEVLEALEQTPQTAGLVFTLANEIWDETNWSKPVSNGRTADCHISKPFHLREIEAFVERVVGIPKR